MNSKKLLALWGLKWNPFSPELPPLLERILQEYSATGMPPAYLPKTSPEDTGEPS